MWNEKKIEKGRLKMVRFLALLVAASGLIACSGFEKPKPTELSANPDQLGVRVAWRANIGEVKYPLAIKAVDDQIVMASSTGVVTSINASTGAENWRLALGANVAAGVGSDGVYTSVISQDNFLITLRQGKEIWRQKLSALSLTAPLVAGNRVFVLMGDRSLAAFDASVGKKLWQQQKSADVLTLGQAGLLTAVGDTLVAGQGGKLVGMDPGNGASRWEVTVANSRGTNEVERLVEVVAGFSREADSLCVRSFQTAVACVDVKTTSLAWSKAASGYSGMAGDMNTIYGSESDGKVMAWSRSVGERQWVNEKLRFRGLTAPLLAGNTLVLGDSQGIVHFMASQDGALLTRIATDGSAIAAVPALAGNTIVVVTQKGQVLGIRPN